MCRVVKIICCILASRIEGQSSQASGEAPGSSEETYGAEGLGSRWTRCMPWLSCSIAAHQQPDGLLCC